MQPEQHQRDGDGGIVELKRAAQADVEPAKMIVAEPVIEALCGQRDQFARDPDLVADNKVETSR